MAKKPAANKDKKAPPNKGGRPQRDFDQTTFEGLCRHRNTEQDICDILATTDKTLSEWCKRTYGVGFSEVYKRFSAYGRVSTRNALFKLIKAGNPSAVIYGCKTICGLHENVDTEERDLRLRILRAQAEAAEAGRSDPLEGRQVIIINDTKPNADGEAESGADPDQQSDNS